MVAFCKEISTQDHLFHTLEVGEIANFLEAFFKERAA